MEIALEKWTLVLERMAVKRRSLVRVTIVVRERVLRK
jgi:hypothetical protein